MIAKKRPPRAPRQPEISIQIHCARWKTRLRPYVRPFREACAAALSGHPGEVTLLLADDAFMRRLNHTYRGKDKPTNVLSFEGEGEHLGDIVLAFETIEREAREQQKSFHDHAVHLTVHGVLHLLGHDHENEKDAEAMERLEIKILKKLGISNPYLS